MNLCHVESALKISACIIHVLTQVCPLAGVSCVAPAWYKESPMIGAVRVCGRINKTNKTEPDGTGQSWQTVQQTFADCLLYALLDLGCFSSFNSHNHLGGCPTSLLPEKGQGAPGRGGPAIGSQSHAHSRSLPRALELPLAQVPLLRHSQRDPSTWKVCDVTASQGRLTPPGEGSTSCLAGEHKQRHTGQEAQVKRQAGCRSEGKAQSPLTRALV